MAEAPQSFWHHLRRRIIAISTMERDVRLAFVVGSTTVVLAIAVNFLGDHLGPSVDLVIGTLPLGVILALGFGEFAILFFVFLALLLIKGRWRYVLYGLSLVGFMIFVIFTKDRILSFALVIPLAMLCVFAYLGERQGWSTLGYMQGALSATLAAMLIFALYAVMGREDLIIVAVSWQGMLAMFGLCMVGTDIAELAVVAVESATAWPARIARGTPVPLALALAAIGTAMLLTIIPINHTSYAIGFLLGRGLAMAAILGLVYWLIISGRRKIGLVAVHIDYQSLLLIVGVYFVALQAGAILRLIEDPGGYRDYLVLYYPEPARLNFLGMIGFVVAVLIFGRRSEKLLVRLAYGVAVGIFFVLEYGMHFYATIELIGDIAIGSLVFLALAPISRKIRANYATACWIVADLNLAFLALWIATIVFYSAGSNAHAGTWTVTEALFVLLALAWDLVTSGESISNRNSHAFPRLARVGLFIAYVMTVAVLVMVATAGKFIALNTGEPIEGTIFNSEGLVGVGLQMFGAPLIFVMAALRLRNLLVATEVPVEAEPYTEQTIRAPADSTMPESAVQP